MCDECPSHQRTTPGQTDNQDWQRHWSVEERLCDSWENMGNTSTDLPTYSSQKFFFYNVKIRSPLLVWYTETIIHIRLYINYLLVYQSRNVLETCWKQLHFFAIPLGGTIFIYIKTFNQSLFIYLQTYLLDIGSINSNCLILTNFLKKSQDTFARTLHWKTSSSYLVTEVALRWPVWWASVCIRWDQARFSVVSDT